MNKRLGAGLLAAASTASVLGLTAAPATAATPCGTYPPGAAYTLARAPFSSVVKVGTTVGTRGTLRRNGQACLNFPLGLYAKPATQVGYRIVASGRTDSTGSVRKAVKVNQTTRYFYNLNLGGGQNVRSGISQFVTRR